MLYKEGCVCMTAPIWYPDISVISSLCALGGGKPLQETKHEHYCKIGTMEDSAPHFVVIGGQVVLGAIIT